MNPDTVVIHYRRPPDGEQQFTQLLVARAEDCIVTLLPSVPLPAPKQIDGTVALEPGAPVIWFTFPGAWHDIGRFHRCDGTFTGFYANVLTPVRGTDARVWETTDLFLDIWQAPGAAPMILDADELEHAAARAWIDETARSRALAEAAAVLDAAAAGMWPPPVVHAWPLERVLRHVGS